MQEELYNSKKILEAIDTARWKLERIRNVPTNYQAMQDLIIQIDNLKNLLEEKARNEIALEYANLCM